MVPDKDFTKLLEATLEYQKPHWHRPVDLGIKGFKRFVRDLPLSKGAKTFMIRRYKTRAWMEFEALPGPKGTFPNHPKYGKQVKVKQNLEIEYDIEVKRE